MRSPDHGSRSTRPRRKEWPLQKCLQCGASYEIQPKYARAGKCRYCSPKCWYAHLRTDVKAKERLAKLRRPKVVVHKSVCQECKREFVHPWSALKRKFCSISCRGKAKRKAMPIANCRACGKAVAARATTRPRVYCSRKCSWAHRVGPNNSLWRGQRAHERGISWPKQRDLARKRDDNTCQNCGARSRKGQKISVDHIVPYRLAVKYTAGNPLYDPNNLFNLICLCRADHSAKTRIEARLLDGDIVGFMQSAKKVVPLDRLIEAMRYSQLPIIGA